MKTNMDPTRPNDLAFTEYQADPCHPGLTKREFFAAMALIGCLASDNAPAAERAVEIADDLIEALNKPRHRYTDAEVEP